MKLRAGDWVEVKNKEEILRTLDKKGQLENMPFMPQMFQYCGKRFQVYKRAHKTCDTVNPVRSLRVHDAVHLDLRCDGEAYGGCQTACLIFWKTAWLTPLGETGSTNDRLLERQRPREANEFDTACCTEADVWAARYVECQEAAGGPRYRCQATQLPSFGPLLPWWNIRQYVEDYTAGNATLGQLFRGLVYVGYFNLAQAGIGLGRPLRWLYDRFQSIRGGIPYPRKSGTIPVGQPTPTCTLDLRPGEFARVKSYKEILGTLNTENKNRGLYFDAEEVPYCGHTYRVKSRLNTFIDEKTGRLVTLRNPAIILEGVWCQSRYSECRMFCPRSIYPWWREIWLERVHNETSGDRAPITPSILKRDHP